MNKEVLIKLKEDVGVLAVTFILGIIILKLTFNEENFLTIIRTTSSFFWLFIIPGFAFLYCWRDKLTAVERLIVAIPISLATLGISSYYVGLLGLHLKYHGVLLPLLIITASLILNRNKILEMDKKINKYHNPP